MQPDLDAVASELGGRVDLVVVDASRQTREVMALRVLATPTLIAVREGKEIARFTGRRSRAELRELFMGVVAGDTRSIARTSKSDRTVWTVAGVLLTAVGLASGPSWPLVAVAAILLGLALLAGVRRSNG